MNLPQSSKFHTPLTRQTRNLNVVVRMLNSVTVASEVEVAPAMVTDISLHVHSFEDLEA
jgi:hypothetical protein